MGKSIFETFVLLWRYWGTTCDNSFPLYKSTQAASLTRMFFTLLWRHRHWLPLTRLNIIIDHCRFPAVPDPSLTCEKEAVRASIFLTLQQKHVQSSVIILTLCDNFSMTYNPIPQWLHLYAHIKPIATFSKLVRDHAPRFLWILKPRFAWFLKSMKILVLGL